MIFFFTNPSIISCGGGWLCRARLKRDGLGVSGCFGVGVLVGVLVGVRCGVDYLPRYVPKVGTVPKVLYLPSGRQDSARKGGESLVLGAVLSLVFGRQSYHWCLFFPSICMFVLFLSSDLLVDSSPGMFAFVVVVVVVVVVVACGAWPCCFS